MGTDISRGLGRRATERQLDALLDPFEKDDSATCHELRNLLSPSHGVGGYLRDAASRPAVDELPESYSKSDSETLDQSLTKECPKCGGRGLVVVHIGAQREVKCSTCKGTGRVRKE